MVHQNRTKTASNSVRFHKKSGLEEPLNEIKPWDYSTSKSIFTVILAVFHLLDVLKVPLQE